MRATKASGEDRCPIAGVPFSAEDCAAWRARCAACYRQRSAEAPKPKRPRLITTKQAALILAVSDRTIRDWIAGGKLRALELGRDRNPRGRRYRMVYSDVESLLSEHDPG